MISQMQCCIGKLTTTNSDGTLVKIEIQHLVNIIKKIVISFQKIGQRAGIDKWVSGDAFFIFKLD